MVQIKSTFLLLAGLAVARLQIPLSSEPRHAIQNAQVGDRPYYLVNDMTDGPLKQKLQSCSEGPFHTTDFIFAHRGASLLYPEHTVEADRAAARQGAGTLECDVTFTKDRQLVCRHSQCDLHYTTNILEKPELAAKCTKPFTPYNGTKIADATCCTSDITLAEFKSLCGKMEGFEPKAKTPAEYVKGTPYFRTDLYSSCGTLMSHADFIDLVQGYGLRFTPEIKIPFVKMPFAENYTREAYAQQIVDDYKTRNIDPARVFFQSYFIEDLAYLIAHEPAFAKQAILLNTGLDLPSNKTEMAAQLKELKAGGINIVGPPIFALLQMDAHNKSMVPSDYAVAIKQANMSAIPWSFERSGWMSKDGGGFFYQSVSPLIKKDGDMYTALDVLAKQVGIQALFTDWPASVTYYANCMGL